MRENGREICRYFYIRVVDITSADPGNIAMGSKREADHRAVQRRRRLHFELKIENNKNNSGGLEDATGAAWYVVMGSDPDYYSIINELRCHRLIL